MDEGDVKVMRAMRKVLDSIETWRHGKPTGRFSADIEVHANQGGVGDVFIEIQERSKV